MKRRIEKMVGHIRKVLHNFFGPKVSVLPLRMIRVSEKFDIVMRPPFRGGFVVRTKD